MGRMAFDSTELKRRIKEQYGTFCNFANKMGMSASALSARLNNRAEWSIEEMHLACNLLSVQASEVNMLFFTKAKQDTKELFDMIKKLTKEEQQCLFRALCLLKASSNTVCNNICKYMEEVSNGNMNIKIFSEKLDILEQCENSLSFN